VCTYFYTGLSIVASVRIGYHVYLSMFVVIRIFARAACTGGTTDQYTVLSTHIGIDGVLTSDGSTQVSVILLW
jgi:hypothetical protein